MPDPDTPPGGAWIFGYGSLVWRPAFDFETSQPARLRGYRRLFWQGSTDHRGVPGAPGRVVTLLPDATAVCWGRAYLVAREGLDDVLATLDHREKGGYLRAPVSLELADAAGHGHSDGSDATITALLYAATPENPNYLGDAPLCEMARQVCAARGPSGANVDYVLELAAALRDMGAHDAHVFELESEVRALLDAAPRDASAATR